jgi:hypothetical protein
MQDRFAFTARYWGDAAVVCRAKEDLPGPVVNQEFGQFQTWTQANAFASRLNEGLEIDSTEAEHIITGSILHTSKLLREIDSPQSACDRPSGSMAAKPLRLQLMLAELDLAATFCRIVRYRPGKLTNRLLRNARNALFDAMHFVCHSELPAGDLEAITVRLQKLQAAFEEFSQ